LKVEGCRLTAIAAAAILALAAFASAQEPAAIPPEKWRTQFAKHEVIQRVRPKEFKGYLANPHRGTATFQRFNGDPLYPGERWSDAVAPVEFTPLAGVAHPPPGEAPSSSAQPGAATLHNGPYPDTTVSYCRWVWSVIEPEKGKYRWDIIDGALKAARERGQTLEARLQPSAGSAPYPAWFWETGAKRMSRGRRAEPDFNDPLYVQHWTDLIRAFAARYDGNPDLESFDVAYAGSCGETGGNSTPATSEKLVDAYLDGFKKTQLIGMLGTHGCKYAMTRRPGIGWRVDSFGDIHVSGSPDVPPGMDWNHMYETYPRSLVQSGAEDAWKTAPVILETGWTVGYWKQQGWNIDWILEWGLRNHCSVFMPKSCAIPAEYKDKIEEFSNRLGYRFVLRQATFPLEARPGDPIQFDVYVDNMGVAPIYRDYKLALRFTQDKTVEVVRFAEDLRRWLPGQKWFTEKPEFPKSLKPGIVKIDMAIVEAASNKPIVQFASEGYGADGWLPLRYMDVLAPKAQ
jgi:hypothetical protein